MTTTESDSELWARAVAGNGTAFGALFDRHARAVYNHCFRLTASWAAAEDLVQETFLLAWRKRDRVRLHHETMLPWLLVTATNAARNEWRSLGRRLRLTQRTPADLPTVDHADAVADRVDDERRMERLIIEVQRLPRNQREALALCFWSGLSYAEAAAALGIAEVSVRARVSKARTRLAGLAARLEQPVVANTLILEDR